MGRRLVKAGVAAGAALMLAACSGGGAGGGAADESVAPAATKGADKDPKHAPLAQPGTVTVMYCYDAPGFQTLILRSYAVKDGTLVAERATRLAEGFRVTTGCDGNSTGGIPVRLGFNKDLTQVAGVAFPDHKRLSSGRAAVADLGTGNEIAPPDPDAFSKPPSTSVAVFHPVTGRLWYDHRATEHVRSEDPVYSRDPGKGAATEKKVDFAEIPDLLREDADTAAAVLALDRVDALAAPGADGVFATSRFASPLALERLRRDGTSGPQSLLEEIVSDDLDVMLDEERPECDPILWRDATTLVCDFQQITFSADYERAEKTVDLIPDSNRENASPVPSPDGQALAFLSKGESGGWALFRTDLAEPGAQPVKITDLDTPPPAEWIRPEASLVRWN
ncbi:hypothetical protein I3F58_11815 [Streptomyces sp. MUM 203J]|nr:hypothetical protein [Streptomyces sp. MUM 203J]